MEIINRTPILLHQTITAKERIVFDYTNVRNEPCLKYAGTLALLHPA